MENDKITKIFRNVELNETFKLRFFRELSKTDNPYPWFDELDKRDFFNPINNKKPTLEKDGFYKNYYWPILDYLENLSKKIEEDDNKTMANKLVKKIDEIIKYEKLEKIDNFYTNWGIIKTIFNLPPEFIRAEYYDYIYDSLNTKFDNTLISAEFSKTIIPKLIKKNNVDNLLKLFKILLKGKEKGLSYDSVLNNYWFYEIYNLHINESYKSFNEKLINLIEDQINNLLNEKASLFNRASIYTIEGDQRITQTMDYEEIITYMWRDCLLNLSNDKLLEFIKRYFDNNYEIYKRMSIYIMNKKYDILKDLFWSILINPIEIDGIKQELYYLFKNNVSKFSQEKIEKIINWIEAKNYGLDKIYENNPEKIKKLESYHKREWLSALLEINNKKVNELYQYYYQIYPVELEHPGYDIWFSGTIVSIPDSESLPDEILEKTNDEITTYLVTYKEPQQPSPFLFYNTIEGKLKRSIFLNPNKFLSNIDPFLILNSKYHYAMIMGFYDAHNSKKEFNWSNLLNFCDELIQNKKIWDKSDLDKSDYNKLLVKAIADILLSGLENTDEQYDKDQLKLFEKILFFIVDKPVASLINEKNVIISVLNSTLGSIYSALIYYSIKMKEANQEGGWLPEVKNYFDSLLTAPEKRLEFYVCLGQHITQLIYLDERWVLENVDKIFKKRDKRLWKYGFSSYLFYANRLSIPLYNKLIEQDHYSKALSEFIDDNISLSRIVSHAFLSYLIDNETDFESSLLKKLFTHIKSLEMLVLNVWRNREKFDESHKNKIIFLWDKILEIPDIIQKREYKTVNTHLINWLSIFPIMDEKIFLNIQKSIPNIDKENTHFLIEDLRNHAKKTPKYVGVIFYTMLKNDIYPWIQKNDIREMIEILYNNNEIDIANRICNLYLSTTYDFLKDICEKYNPKK